MIIDANIIIYTLVSGPYSEKARQIFNANTTLAAPDILTGEVANALAKMLRTQIITRHQAELFFDTLEGLPIIYFNSKPLLANAFTLSLDFNHGFFDCLYVEAARSNASQFLTADARLVKKFQGSEVNIIHLNDWNP